MQSQPYALDLAYHRLSTEGRLVSDVPTVQHELGRFQVKWDKQDLQLKVTHRKRWCMSTRDCYSTAWSTVPGLPFLIAANGGGSTSGVYYYKKCLLAAILACSQMNSSTN